MTEPILEPENSLGFLLQRAAWKGRQTFQILLKKSGVDLTPEQVLLMFKLERESSRSQTELAQITFKDKANVTRLLDTLTKKGLVVREADPEDRRKFLVRLTDDGQQMREKLVHTFNHGQLLLKQAFGGAAQVEEINQLLRQIHDVIEQAQQQIMQNQFEL